MTSRRFFSRILRSEFLRIFVWSLLLQHSNIIVVTDSLSQSGNVFWKSVLVLKYAGLDLDIFLPSLHFSFKVGDSGSRIVLGLNNLVTWNLFPLLWLWFELKFSSFFATGFLWSNSKGHLWGWADSTFWEVRKDLGSSTDDGSIDWKQPWLLFCHVYREGARPGSS